MKKLTLWALIFALSLCLLGCSGEKCDHEEELELYDKYERIIELLEEDKYEAAVARIARMYEKYMENQPQEDPTQDPPPSDEEPAAEESREPTEEDMDLLYQYRELVWTLDGYEPGDSIWYHDEVTGTGYDGSDAFRIIYQRLQEMEVIDVWLQDPDFIANTMGWENINCDRQSYLDRFVVIRDVKLCDTVTETDNLGNVDTHSGDYWRYNARGEECEHYYYTWDIERINHWNSSSPYTLEYNDLGQVVKKTYGRPDHVEAVVTYSYDEAGRILTETVRTNSGEKVYDYHYDDQSRLSRIFWTGQYSAYALDYTYDSQGRLIQERLSSLDLETASRINSTIFFDYVYEGDVLVSGTFTDQWWLHDAPYYESIDHYAYTCDDQGRVIHTIIQKGDSYHCQGDEAGTVYQVSDIREQFIETTYGDYYIFE